MICPKCQTDADNIFIVEHFPCCECNAENTVAYHMCPDCSTMWRSFNGNLIADSLTELGGFANAVMTLDDDEKFFEGLREDLKKHERVKRGEAMMSDFIHKCLKCDSVAFPVTERSFKCSSCGFEWEVIAVE